MAPWCLARGGGSFAVLSNGWTGASLAEIGYLGRGPSYKSVQSGRRYLRKGKLGEALTWGEVIGG